MRSIAALRWLRRSRACGLARQAALHSYSPYSGFKVGAALRLTNGETVTATNVENVSVRADHLWPSARRWCAP